MKEAAPTGVEPQMLRTLLLAPVLALVLGAPSLAAAEQFPESALHAEIRSHDGTVMGRVEAVERDGEGRIVAIEAPGLEPADAPAAPNDLIADNERGRYVAVTDRRAQAAGSAAAVSFR